MLLDRKLWITIVLLVSIFIVTSYFSQKYQSSIEEYVRDSNPVISASIYLGATITSTVIAPVTTLPLMPLIAGAWGSLIAGLLTIIGSAIGGLIAFLLAKKLGRPIISKLASEEDLKKIEQIIPREPEHAFWTIAFLHLVMPADILSYALGLLFSVGARTYFLATLVGISPAIMILAYSGNLPVRYQILILSTGVAVIFLLLRYWISHLRGR